MAGIYDVNAQDLIEKTADELKKLPEIHPPQWAPYVKTGRHKERPPINEDWWYMRSAAVLRAVAKLGPVGTAKLRTKYGGKANRGVKPEHHYKGSGSVIRKVLQQLETAGLISKSTKGLHKGRILSGKGQSLLMKSARVLGAGTTARKPVDAKAPKAKKEGKKDGRGASKKEAGGA